MHGSRHWANYKSTSQLWRTHRIGITKYTGSSPSASVSAFISGIRMHEEFNFGEVIRSWLWEGYMIKTETFVEPSGKTRSIPNDDTEQSREDMKHAMLLELTDGKLFYAPIGDHPQQILDIGTGTGESGSEMLSSKHIIGWTRTYDVADERDGNISQASGLSMVSHILHYRSHTHVSKRRE